MTATKTETETKIETTTLVSEPSPAISLEALAQLGDGEIAYVKPIRADQVAKLFPQVPEIEPGTQLFALHAADGTPIMLTDSREAAIANAWSHELETVSVH